jgi:hypothetical protein
MKTVNKNAPKRRRNRSRAKIHRLASDLAEAHQSIAMLAGQLADKREIIRKLTA